MNTVDKQTGSINLEGISWQEMFVMTEHWQSDMAFFKDELRFFQRLLDKFFVLMMKDETLNDLQAMVAKMDKASKESTRLYEKMTAHRQTIGRCTVESTKGEAQKVLDKHASLQHAFSEYVKNFRELKKEVFRIAENTMSTEKLQHLLHA